MRPELLRRMDSIAQGKAESEEYPSFSLPPVFPKCLPMPPQYADKQGKSRWRTTDTPCARLSEPCKWAALCDKSWKCVFYFMGPLGCDYIACFGFLPKTELYNSKDHILIFLPQQLVHYLTYSRQSVSKCPLPPIPWLYDVL